MIWTLGFNTKNSRVILFGIFKDMWGWGIYPPQIKRPTRRAKIISLRREG